MEKLNWAQNAKKRLALGNASFAGLYPLLNTKSKLDERLKHRLYKSCIRPVLMYAAPIWKNVAPSNLKKLQKFQNRCLRTIAKTPLRYPSDALHRETGHPKIREFIQNTSKSFFHNSRSNPFPEINKVGRFDPRTLLFRRRFPMPHEVDCN